MPLFLSLSHFFFHFACAGITFISQLTQSYIPSFGVISLQVCRTVTIMPHHESHSSQPNYGSYQQKIYLDGLKGNRPILTTNPHKWEEAAKEVLPASSYGYIAGAAGAGETMDANRAAFRK
jgi:hypothetical protein